MTAKKLNQIDATQVAARDDTGRYRLRYEYQITANLSIEGIVKIIDIHSGIDSTLLVLQERLAATPIS